MNKQQLAAKIWASANKMRSTIEANEYKDYILGFIFYKFLSEKLVKRLKQEGWGDDDLKELNEEDTEMREYIQKNMGYFIGYKNLFSTWINKGNDFSVDDVSTALSAFNRLINPEHKKLFNNIFDTLQTGLSKLGSTANAQTKSVRDLIDLINDIPMSEKQDYDILGFIYEYLISNFAANAGKKAGEFYTPHEVSVLMSEITAHHLKDRSEIKIYDPTSGSGSLLINIGKCIAQYAGNENHIKYYAQELKENTYNLTRMNLVMRGISVDNIVTRNADTLEDDWPYFDESNPAETYEPLYVDSVVSNPPYSQVWNPKYKETDPRYKEYGVAPKGKADFAFLLHDLYHVKPDGIMTIVLPHGVLFRGNEEGGIRKNLVEKNKIDAIIGLPPNVFFGTGIPTIIMVLKQNKNNTDVLFIDASKGFVKEGKSNKLRGRDIKKIVDAVKSRQSIPHFANLVSRETIRENDYNLNIPRYVDSSEKAESWDIYAVMFGGIPESELNAFQSYWEIFDGLKEKLFEKINDEYWELKNLDLASTIHEHGKVNAFKAEYNKAFENYDTYLTAELIDNMEKVNLAKEKTAISDDIFNRLQSIPLIDKYDAYHLLDDAWKNIAIDLETIQLEGKNAIKQVDPNYVVKKKKGEDVTVQEGWLGHILPFDMVQKKLLSADLKAIETKETELLENMNQLDQLLEELDEEEKEKPFVNDDKDAFIEKEVNAAIKAQSVEEKTLNILKEVKKLIAQKKKIGKEIKTAKDNLHNKTKTTIETLNDDQVKMLLREKWIVCLAESLHDLPHLLLTNFQNRLDALSKKYETTLPDIQNNITETEQALSVMLEDLTGSDFDMQGLNELKKLLESA